MSYIIFARKWRPKNFDEVIGQEYIISILKNSIKQNRLAHAYLFTGPRGIGKTSCARILAKSLNCIKGPTLKPCEECSSCREIAQGRNLDVIEIDGASNRGIDEIRTLRENVKFSPTSGKYKIYIIDEVHMLTTEAFNALLKTLEEPPAHVKFIFATTQPRKIISTILSRCQRFDFRLIPIVKIIEKLEKISKQEHLKVEKEALFAIARASGGSMRDAETILDQLSSFSKDKINAQDVSSMLGMVEAEFLFEIADCIVKKDSLNAMKQLDLLINDGKDPNQFIADFIEHFRNLMLAKIGGKLLESLLDLPDEVKQRILEQSQNFSLQEILNVIEALIQTQEMARFIDSVRIPLEMTLTKLTLPPHQNLWREGLSKQNNPYKQPNTDQRKIKATDDLSIITVTKSHPEPKGQKDNSQEPKADNINSSINLEQISRMWPEVLKKISKIKMSVATYLQEGILRDLEKNKITICFPVESKFHKESLEHKDNTQLIQQSLKEIFNTDIKVLFVVSEDEKEKKHSDGEPFIKSTLDTFKGKVIGRWYRHE